MHPTDTRNRFIELRARGCSLARIAPHHLDVAKRTLVDWNQYAQVEIRALKASVVQFGFGHPLDHEHSKFGKEMVKKWEGAPLLGPRRPECNGIVVSAAGGFHNRHLGQRQPICRSS